jgi:hypothetical protein
MKRMGLFPFRVFRPKTPGTVPKISEREFWEKTTRVKASIFRRSP